jgi:hypothetical protein
VALLIFSIDPGKAGGARFYLFDHKILKVRNFEIQPVGIRSTVGGGKVLVGKEKQGILGELFFPF